ncbi:uncharacterized protein LOC107788161 isoform X3 [Nicotiana tabacum]|uniref:Uncharacterized protein LOC107788161 isoform X3 n=1 Tax=Nicotiana tabacum TaxID=4097 RepID=A0A1S3ZLS9_TOBAC|nr:PREDICTED: uncharacterized protein LOC107788161 isoform X2 [Nicotiana tabacum]XP_033511579.1 uncharacterized protein LOC104094491 isoform X2 [Nicotiana tomentosiformis]
MEATSVTIPRFNGDNPKAWIFQVEQYFTRYNIFSDHKLSLASLYLDGEALDWYCWLYRNKQLADWDHFVAKLFIRFRNRDAPKGHSAFLRQLTTVDYYPTRGAAIPPWCTMANSLLPQSCNAQSDYNNFNLAHKVFGEKSDTNTDIVVDVETMLPTPDAVKPEGCDENASILIENDSAGILATQAKEEICHSVLDANTENADFPLPQYFVEPSVYNNNEAQKVFVELFDWSKDTTLDTIEAQFPTDPECHVALSDEANDCANAVENKDKNDEEKIVTIGKEILQFVPAIIVQPLSWIGSTFSCSGDLVMFNTQHGLELAQCLKEMSCIFLNCNCDQLIKRGIFNHFSGLSYAAPILTLRLFPPDRLGLDFPFDPGSSLLTMFLRVTRICVFCAAVGVLELDKFMASTLWDSCNWVDTEHERNLHGSLLSKLGELAVEDKIHGVLEAFAGRYFEPPPNILVNRALGSEVTLIAALDQLIPGFALEISKLSQQVLIHPKKIELGDELHGLEKETYKASKARRVEVTKYLVYLRDKLQYVIMRYKIKKERIAEIRRLNQKRDQLKYAFQETKRGYDIVRATDIKYEASQQMRAAIAKREISSNENSMLIETLREHGLAIPLVEQLSDDGKMIFSKGVDCWLYYISNACKPPFDLSCALDGFIGIQLSSAFIYLAPCHVNTTFDRPGIDSTVYRKDFIW